MEILIVDDDFVTRGLLKHMLAEAGHTVLVAEDGEEGLELVRRHKVGMVITDWMMPGMEGPQLCEAIRAEDTGHYVFIIMLTSKDGQDDIISGLESGADDYLCKPFNHAELLARLKSGIRMLELEQSLRQANEEIRLLSETDPLTGCYNRGYLSSHLKAELQRSVRYGHPLSLVLCDLDHFKMVNDTHGHLAGDLVLQKFALLMLEGLRMDVDWVVRYGGEEFLIVLPETPMHQAVRVAERIRSAIECARLESSGTIFQVTASFGVSGIIPGSGNRNISTDTLISSADDMLYRAKKAGRNRVVCGNHTLNRPPHSPVTSSAMA